MAASKVLEPDQSYFESIPFCAKIIQDPNYIITPTRSRQAKESTEDSFFAQTLKTKDTVPACITVYRRPPPGSAQADEVRTIYSLASGVNGYPHVCHGGMVAAMLDEAMGTLLAVNKDLAPSLAPAAFTAYMNVSYRKFISTPQVVVATARLEEVKARKVFVTGDIKNGDGVVMATVDSMWLLPKERL